MNGTISSEKFIISPVGRLLTSIWVLFGILVLCFLTSVLSSTLTSLLLNTNQIMTASDLSGNSVCMQSGYASHLFDKSFPGVGVQKTLVANSSACYAMVSAGTVTAAFDLREEAITYFQQGFGSGLLISPVIKPQGYGMVMMERYEYGSWINEALLMWQQGIIASSITYSDSTRRWFFGNPYLTTYGGAALPSQNLPKANYKWSLIATAIALVASYMTLQVRYALILQQNGGPRRNVGCSGASKLNDARR